MRSRSRYRKGRNGRQQREQRDYSYVKTGLASNQQAYEENVYALFKSLDRLEKHLADSPEQRYLFGNHITEADIRLYTTLARFDVAYFTIFKCNLKMIRYDYPHLHLWLRRLYWDESERTNGGAFKATTRFAVVRISKAGDVMSYNRMVC